MLRALKQVENVDSSKKYVNKSEIARPTTVALNNIVYERGFRDAYVNIKRSWADAI